MKSFQLLLICMLFLLSCENNDTIIPISTNSKNEVIKNKEIFGKALAKALYNEPSLRKFIKQEALYKFDKDYDVLYQNVKNKIVKKDLTFKNIIESYLKEKSIINEIEDKDPLLTIYIPELPENSFSAEIWDTSKDIPLIAICENNEINIINEKSEVYTLDKSQIPAFPVLVVKDCERVNFKNTITRGISNNAFEFIDPYFDNSIPTTPQIATRSLSIVDTKINQAYNIYKNTNGWQRDYIYYNITPSQTRGSFSYDYQEFITTFKLGNETTFNLIDKKTDDAYGIVYKLVDGTGDPQPNDGPNHTNKYPGWTDGHFEFLFTIKINATNGAGEYIKKYADLAPSQIFDLQCEKNGNLYHVTAIKLKTATLNLPIFNWNLAEYSPSIKITVEEVDPSETIVYTEQESAKFAANFEADFKVGLKFGTSFQKTVTTSTQKTISLGNDQLGDIIVNFGDKILTIDPNNPNSIIKRKYSNTSYNITVEPRKVQ